MGGFQAAAASSCGLWLKRTGTAAAGAVGASVSGVLRWRAWGLCGLCSLGNAHWHGCSVGCVGYCCGLSASLEAGVVFPCLQLVSYVTGRTRRCIVCCHMRLLQPAADSV
jgi:hypothetical protein